MEQVKYKTLEEHRTYLHEMVRLKLFFLHLRLEQHPEESFRDVIRNRVDIYRKTDANPGPMTPGELFFDQDPWLFMEQKAEALYLKYKDDRTAFERNAFEVFRDSIDARCERDYSDPSPFIHYQCGCFRHDWSLMDGSKLTFHIGNTLKPRSFLDDKAYLKDCFLHLMNVAEKMFGAKHIRTNTWLNSCPKWVALFPDEWKTNMQDANENVNWTYAYWGQFLTSRATFNFKYGEIMRTTGRFPYYPRASFCSIDAMRKKVEEYV